MASPLSGYTLVYGGSFNPPHMGHQLACRFGLESLGADELWVVPVHSHPFGKDLAAFEDRLAMCRLMVAPLGKRACVSSIEAELTSPVRTFELFTALQQAHPKRSFAVLLGSDLLAETDDWYRFPELQELVRIVVVGRAGFKVPTGDDVFEAGLPDISSREIRARLQSGESVVEMLSETVQDYLSKNDLYTPSP